MISKIFRYLGAIRIKSMQRRAMAKLLANEEEISSLDEKWETSVLDPTFFYQSAFVVFHKSLPTAMRQHRGYFTEKGRSFGEDAFHVMWWMLFKRFNPSTFLEIGVYRGQVLSLVSLIARLEDHPCRVVGISPFSSIGDTVSKYRNDLDYQSDTLANFEHFSLPKPELHKGYSTDVDAVALIRSTRWDMIYIDGNHDYDVVLKDWEVCSESIKIGGIIILDDSGLSSKYQPPVFATGGHPGPSRLASEIDSARFEEVLQVGHNRVFKRLF